MSVSSLLKSAETARKRQQEYEESVMAYEWQLSAKSYADFQAYSKYLEDQKARTTDPSELLSYDKTINSARSGYISNEIQRQTINVLEGRGTNQQKQSKMIDLYYMSIDNGNLDLAQSLRQQIDNLDRRIQSEAESAQRLADKMARLNAKSIEEAVDTLKDYSEELNELFKERGTQQFAEDMQAYSEELGVEPGDFFGMKLRIAEEINNVYDEAISGDPNEDNLRKFQKAKNEFNTEKQLSLPGTGGKSIKVSYQDLVDQADAARTGQTLFRTIQTEEGTTFEKNKETGFVWGRDAEGNYRMISVYEPSVPTESGIYRTRVDEKGNVEYLDSNDNVVALKKGDGEIQGVGDRTIEDAAKRSYEDLLKQSGFNIVGTSDGFITVANPGNIPGVASETVRLYVNPDGKLQVAGEGEEFYNLDFDEATGEFRGVVEDVPNPITPTFGDKAAFSQEFLNNLDKSALTPGTIGVIDFDLASDQLLQAAEIRRDDLKQEQLAEIERASRRAEQRARTRASQRLQPAINPQQPSRVRIQAPKPSPQKAAPVQRAADIRDLNNITQLTL